MESGLLAKFFSLLANPLVLIGGIVLIPSILSNRSPRLPWLLFACCCFAASLGKFQSESIPEPPALVFPLQQLRDIGRPLTIFLLGLLVLLAQKTADTWTRVNTPKPIRYLTLVQCAIFAKNFLFGNVVVAILAFLLFGIVLFLMNKGIARWLQDDEDFERAVWSVALSGVIFIIANGYQAAINTYPITFVKGQFLGTTNNPQMAALSLVCTIPGFIFLIERHTKTLWIKAVWVVFLLFVLIALFFTGSRTGAIMGVIAILFFYRQRQGALIRLGFLAGIIFSVASPYLNLGTATSEEEEALTVTDKFLLGEDTRSAVWIELWHNFLSSPVFGIPLQGDRLGFGENTWLATASTLGLVGFLPLLLFGVECLKTMLKLNTIANRMPAYFPHCSTVISGLTSLLIGSFAEAFLLGNATLPIFVLFLYLFLGNYLIEKYQMIQQYSSSSEE